MRHLVNDETHPRDSQADEPSMNALPSNGGSVGTIEIFPRSGPPDGPNRTTSVWFKPTMHPPDRSATRAKDRMPLRYRGPT